MKTEEKVLDRSLVSIPFLPLVGPVSVLFSLFLVLVSDVAVPPLLSLVAILGVVLSWQWRLKGCLISYALLASTLFYVYLNGNIEHPFWIVEYALTLALGFAITSLAVQELDNNKDLEIQEQFIERDKVISEVQETFKSSEEALSKEIQVLGEKVQTLENEREKNLLQLNSYAKLVDISRQEILQTRNDYEKGSSELLRKKQEVDRLERELEQAVVRQTGWDEQKKLYAQYEASVEAKIKTLVAEKEKSSKENLDLTSEKERYEEIFKEQETRIKEFMEAIEKMKQQLASPTSLPLDDEDLDLNSKEGKALRRSQGMFKQLREQFEEKSALLDGARKQLFLTEEKLEAMLREYEEQLRHTRTETEEAMSKHLLHLVNQQQESEKEIANLHAVIDAMHRKG